MNPTALTSEQKFELQRTYCKERNLPLFSGIRCWRCRVDIWEYISEEDAKTKLITGCPKCAYSFVD